MADAVASAAYVPLLLLAPAYVYVCVCVQCNQQTECVSVARLLRLLKQHAQYPCSIQEEITFYRERSAEVSAKNALQRKFQIESSAPAVAGAVSPGA
jgi:hypothetical protein